MKIVVSDTNILIDLMNISLLGTFFNLDFEFHTNDLIINEITDPKQKEVISEIIADGKLYVAETRASDYQEILNLKIKNLTFEDCSIWHYARKVKGILLTGDARLRKAVIITDIEVRGILFVLDQLVESQTIEKQIALEKLIELRDSNIRLPQIEIDKRIERWS